MSTPRHFENENLKDRSTYWSGVLFAVIIPIVGQLLFPIIRPHRFSGAASEWILTFIFIISLVVYCLFEKRFISITFDATNRKITLTTETLISGTTKNEYNFKDITFNSGKDAASHRKKASDFVEIYNKKDKVIKLEKTDIGDNCFNNVLAELQKLT